MKAKTNIKSLTNQRVNNRFKQKIKAILQRDIQSTDKRSQMAELLRRNATFLEQLEDIRKRLGAPFFRVRNLAVIQDLRCYKGHLRNFPLIKLKYPPIKILKKIHSAPFDEHKLPRDRFFTRLRDLDLVIMRNPKNLYEEQNARMDILANYKSMWGQFCEHWKIDEGWDDKLNSLPRYIDAPVLINPYPLRRMARERAGGITLSLSRWARIEDVHRIWPKIMKGQEAQKEEMFKDKKFDSFLRWYDLSHECGLKPSEIARLWDQYHSDEVDLLALKLWYKEAAKEDTDIKGIVLQDDDDWRSFLARIQSGDLAEKYLEGYKRYRRYYSTGRETAIGKLKKSNVPLVEVVRKAIPRIENKIRALDKAPAPWFTHFLK